VIAATISELNFDSRVFIFVDVRNKPLQGLDKTVNHSDRYICMCRLVLEGELQPPVREGIKERHIQEAVTSHCATTSSPLLHDEAWLGWVSSMWPGASTEGQSRHGPHRSQLQLPNFWRGVQRLSCTCHSIGMLNRDVM
jgi:hypothetical protein